MQRSLNEREGDREYKKGGLKCQREMLGYLARTWIPKTCQWRPPPSGEPGKHKRKRNDVSEYETMQRGCENLITAALHLVRGKGKIHSCQMANKSFVDQLI